MGYFEKKFNIETDSVDLKGEVKVLCPFHPDTKPSATVNLDKRLFHCWVCGKDRAGNEAQIMSKLEGITEQEAYRKLSTYTASDRTNWKDNAQLKLWMNEDIIKASEAIGISKDTLEKVEVGVTTIQGKNFLSIPVFVNNILKDIRAYNILKHKGMAKLYGNEDAGAGWIVPHDLWQNEEGVTYIFEGEKDMLVARDQGINAITLTGGARAHPNKESLESLKGKEIIICYDNDEAGLEGSKTLYFNLKEVTDTVKILDIGQFVPKGHDFADYINKFDGDIFSFSMAELTEPEPEEIKEIDRITVKDALAQSIFKKPLRSLVTVDGELTDTYSVPLTFKVKKVEDVKGDMDFDEERVWELDSEKMYQILPLIETDAKDTQVLSTLIGYLGVPKNERGINKNRYGSKAVYKSFVADQKLEDVSTSLEIYSFERLVVGKNYDVTYKLYPHPNKNQKIVGLVEEVVPLNDVTDFVIDTDKINMLKTSGTIESRLEYLYQSARHHIAPHLDHDIWLMTDLVFNSILEFEYQGIIRGALDVFILGDTQIGKSETSEKLVELYEFGHFLSLKDATVVALIGGSNKLPNDTYVMKIGAIPRQHKKLVVMEEFSGAPPDFIKRMTATRSSGKVRIARATGELVADCVVRMITLSNPINDQNGNPRSLSTFPNGTVPIMELVKSAEDVARYDGFLLTAKKPTFNPYDPKNALQGLPIPKEAYYHKAKWVETREVDDVFLDEDIKKYIWKKAEYLNSIFECNVPIFGTTSYLKLARFSVALSSLLLELNDKGQIVVTEEIVDYMVSWLEKIYSDKYFRLDDVRKDWKSYSNYEPHELQQLQALYNNNVVLLDSLMSTAQTTQGNLQSISGRKRDDFSAVFNKLVQLKAVHLVGGTVYPSEKFRKMYRNLETDVKTVDKFTQELESLKDLEI